MSYSRSIYNYMCENIPTVIMGVITKLIWNYNNLVVFCEHKINYLYDNNVIVKNSIDTINILKNYIYNIFYTSLKEPITQYWISIVYIDQNLYSNFTYTDSYKIINDMNTTMINTNTTISPFINQIIKKDSNILINKNDKHICLICFINGNYLIFINDNIIQSNMLKIQKSKIKILSIFYSHPSMCDTIQFKLSENIFLTNNQLFNSAFVLRCLKMQDEHYIFDNNYKITLMDSNINEYEITYNQYVHIFEDKLEIINII